MPRPMAASLEHLRLLFARLGIVLFTFALLRWVFFIVNRVSFPGLSFADGLLVALHGVRFDAMTIVVANVLLITLHLLPWSGRGQRTYQRMLFVVFLVLAVVSLIFGRRVST